MQKIIIYTDGACSGNPGKGGWAAILIFEKKKNQLTVANKALQIIGWN